MTNENEKMEYVGYDGKPTNDKYRQKKFEDIFGWNAKDMKDAFDLANEITPRLLFERGYATAHMIHDIESAEFPVSLKLFTIMKVVEAATEFKNTVEKAFTEGDASALLRRAGVNPGAMPAPETPAEPVTGYA